MKVAVVGCGVIAQQYARDIQSHEQLELVAATDLRPERARRFAEAHACTPYNHLDALLAESETELVVNLTIHAAHATVTRACLAAGKHVYSEKPLALRCDEAHGLVALARAQGVHLSCAPANLAGDAQQVAWRLLREGRLGEVRMVYADCHIGRVTQWNANPQPFLEVGPLFDGAVYPLTVLTAYFGPVTWIRAAHSMLLLAEHSHGDRRLTTQTPDHTFAILEFANGTVARLTASMYVPYQTTHFNSLEFHGDAGSLYLRNCGELGPPSRKPGLLFARVGKDYLPVPMPHRPTPRHYASALADMAEAVRSEHSPDTSSGQAAHLVEVINAITVCAAERMPVPVQSRFLPPQPLAWTSQPWPIRLSTRPAGRLPALGFGCSRYRGNGVYVDLKEAIEDALDIGYRLFDTAELYGNERQLGEILRRPGGPPRESLYVVSKVWNTNHAYDHVIAACEATLRELGLEYLDLYLIHWPHAWQHRRPLHGNIALEHHEAEAISFPRSPDGDIALADVPLHETWSAMEELTRRGLTRAIGVSNFDVAQLSALVASSRVGPAVHQIERHPYLNNAELVAWCEARDIQVMAHSPLSAPGLLHDPLLETLAQRYGKCPAQIVLRWNVQQGVIPIPSSTELSHITANFDIFDFHLAPEDMRAIDQLDQPAFQRR